METDFHKLTPDVHHNIHFKKTTLMKNILSETLTHSYKKLNTDIHSFPRHNASIITVGVLKRNVITIPIRMCIRENTTHGNSVQPQH